MMLRTGGAGDLDALLGLERESFGADAWSETTLGSELSGAPETRFVVVAEERDVVVGYGVLMVVAPIADVQRVAVRPGHRRRGIGRALLAAMLAEAAWRGCDTVLLEVASDNAAARELYAADGFDVIHRRPAYYGPGRDALVMSRGPGPANAPSG
jgi:ribosomal-protein-alanine N-acetyltransferase